MSQKYHYIYRITNAKITKYYYGVRTSKIEPKLDLGVKYFSSSSDKEFIRDQKENPQDYRYKIVRICSSRKEAIQLEIKLHNKFDVGVNESFYNRSKQTSTGWDTTGYNHTQKIKDIIGIFSKRKKSEETKQKISNALKGKKHTEERRIKNSISNTGKKHTEETKQKISKLWELGILHGHPHTEETKQKISNNLVYKSEEFRKKCSERMKGHITSEETKRKQSDALKGRGKEIVECPYCLKSGGRPAMMRHHFENCKKKDTNEINKVK